MSDSELARRLARVERRLRALESPGSQLDRTSLEDGAIREYRVAVDGATGEGVSQLVAQYGWQYDDSHGAVPFVGPTPPTPAGVTVIPVPDGVLVSWDGTWVDEGTGWPTVAKLDFTGVEVHASQDPALTGLLGSTLKSVITSSRGGQVYVVSSAETPVYVRLVARSAAGKASVPSATVGPVVADRSTVNWGVSGFLSTAAPGTNRPFLVNTFYGSVPLNANGDGTIVYPRAFPNGTLLLLADHHPGAGAPSNNLEVKPWNSTRSSTAIRGYFGTAILASVSLNVVMLAIGW